MVQIPRGALFAGALALSAGRARSAGALAGLADSFRDVATVDSGSSMVVAGVDALGAPVVPDAFDPLVVAAAALPVVRGAGVVVAGCTGAPRDAPAGATPSTNRPSRTDTTTGRTATGSAPRRAPTTSAPAAKEPASKEPASRGIWTIQLAAYNTRPDAEALVRKLAARGVKARISGDAKPFRVRLDYYDTRQQAAACVEELKERGIIGFVTDEPRATGAPPP